MTIPAKPDAPLLKVVKVSDGGATAGDILDLNPNVNDPLAATEAYCLLVTTTNNAANPTPKGHLMAEKVWNCVWNDYADFQEMAEDEVIPGKAYFDSYEGAKICTERCQLAVMGIASDTFAQIVGKMPEKRQVPIAVAGWVLAYCDKQYPCGTPLTNDENGNLTEMSLSEKKEFPERLIATYKKPENNDYFGTEDFKVRVDGRHWVKVK
ncbi:MAG: hypothetical protein VYA54_09000 [Bdellovibrionota bacterium]|nr:hypothetical protein [Bdellovibrionota bacterium]